MNRAAQSDLVARTRPLDRDPDLIGVAASHGMLLARDGVGLATRGTASIVELDRQAPDHGAGGVAASLNGIETDDAVGLAGCGPIAFAAIGFDRSMPASLTIPQVVVGRSADGTRWLTTITPADHELADASTDAILERLGADERRTAGQIASDVSIRSPIPARNWCDSVAIVRDAIRSGVADKVVLAREIVVTSQEPFDRTSILEELRASYGSCYLYAVGDLVGASPELLVDRHGDVVRAHPMAGTTRRTGDPATDARLAEALLASAKDQREHRLTIDMVHDTLLPWCSYLDEEAQPSIVAIANVAHLATMVEGRLSSPPASVLELVGALHPTPAVCGMPRDTALALIAQHEQLDRGQYAGPVGWVDRHGQGTWAVGIRCASIRDHDAHLYAGVGVVADSDPDVELAETQAKLRALLNALIRP